MSVIFKNITYPNILRLYSVNYSNNTILDGVPQTGETDSSSLSSFIVEFNNYLVQDLGLINIPRSGELDLENIPSYANADSAVNYGFKVYGFTNNVGSPIYLKFGFNIDTLYSNIKEFYLALEILNQNFEVIYSVNLGQLCVYGYISNYVAYNINQNILHSQRVILYQFIKSHYISFIQKRKYFYIK